MATSFRSRSDVCSLLNMKPFQSDVWFQTFSWITVSRPGALTEQGGCLLLLSCCGPPFVCNVTLQQETSFQTDETWRSFAWQLKMVIRRSFFLTWINCQQLKKQPNARSNFLALNFFRIQTCTDIPSKKESYTDKWRCKVDSSFLRGPFSNTSLCRSSKL